VGKFIPGVPSLSSRRQHWGFIFTHENKEPVYPHLSSAAQSKDMKSPAWGGGRGFCMFWESFTCAALRRPEVMLCLSIFFFHSVIIRE